VRCRTKRSGTGRRGRTWRDAVILVRVEVLARRTFRRRGCSAARRWTCSRTWRRSAGAAVRLRIEGLTRRTRHAVAVAGVETLAGRTAVFRLRHAYAAVLARIELGAGRTDRAFPHPGTAVFERDVRLTRRTLRDRQCSEAGCAEKQTQRQKFSTHDLTRGKCSVPVMITAVSRQSAAPVRRVVSEGPGAYPKASAKSAFLSYRGGS
jgi:hypothetical protein